MRTSLRTAPLLVAGALLGACRTTATTRVAEADQTALLPDLLVGSTRREDLVLRFGPPWRSFDDDAIFTWRLSRSIGLGGILAAPYTEPTPDSPLELAEVRRVSGQDFAEWPGGASYSLVVAFGPDGVVRRRALIRVR